MTRFDLTLAGVAVLAAGLIYSVLGMPGYSEQPHNKRLQAIADRDPSDLSVTEMLARLQDVAAARPEDPDPHYHIGVLLRSEQRAEDAARAFQAALRRNDRDVKSLVALGDVMVEIDNGEIGQVAAEAYFNAWQVDRAQVRPGILAGYALQLSGRESDAQALWAAIEQDLSADDPRRAMFDAITNPTAERELTEQ